MDTENKVFWLTELAGIFLLFLMYREDRKSVAFSLNKKLLILSLSLIVLLYFVFMIKYDNKVGYRIKKWYKDYEDIIKSIFTTVGGACLGASIGYYLQNPLFAITIFFISLLLFLFYGFGVWDLILHLWYVQRRSKKLRIGILSDIQQSGADCFEHTDINPQNWKDKLEHCEASNVKLISVLDNFDKFTAILNPYGGAYPEYDLSTYETLNKILNYVREGGFFINVADIPGYFPCPLVKPWRKVEVAYRNAPFAYNYILNFIKMQSLFGGQLWPLERVPQLGDTPFMEKIGLRCINTEEISAKWDTFEVDEQFKSDFTFNETNIQVHRSVIVSKNFEPVINVEPVIKEKEEDLPFIGNVGLTPLFFVRHGEGKFLFSLIWLKEQESNAKNKLVTSIAKLIVNRCQK